MSICTDMGISHSHFLGGPAMWTAEDRAKVVALRMEKSERCSKCGTADWEWEEDRFAYAAVLEVCKGCQHMDLARDMHEGDLPAGASWVMIPGKVAQALLEEQQAKKQRKARA